MLLTSTGKDPHAFHSRLAKFNRDHLSVGMPSMSWEKDERDEHMFRLMEGRYLEELRNIVKPLTKRNTANADEFVSWFESVAAWGPGQYHPLFEWLAHTATRDEMKWFLTQEAAGEAGFEDLVAYTQVKLPAQAKLECARNYWDEMGRGKPKAMHGPLLENMVVDLNLNPTIDATVWESLALANTMLALARARRYTYHSLGALGVIELTAPWRAARVAEGMRRLGFSRRARAYFDLHAVLDIKHSSAWNREIIHPLVTANHECAQYFAEGALMRLQCGKLCFDRYSHEFGLNASDADYYNRKNTMGSKNIMQKVANS